MSVAITADKVVKRYGDLTIIPQLTQNIKNGEFFTLLGPSGCGKTTLLRMIAGFNSIEGGQIRFNDQVINDIPAHKRNIGMVFQSYAIFPHLTVRENVEYGLKLRNMPKDEMKTKVDKILDVVQITEYQDRLPERLSGGQQQRVALARAIVIHPSVLLMDEPLSNLDAKLRVEMRSAIREVQKQVGITTVYVTHDQEEALAISDRIAVMKKGVIQQTGRPHTIYTRPYNVFVATFIGHSNLFKGRIEEANGGKAVVFADGFVLPMSTLGEEGKIGDDVTIAIRPEEFSICGEGQGIKCKIKTKVFLGKYITYGLDFPDDMLVPDQPAIEYSQDLGHAEKVLEIGDTVYLKPNAAKINVFRADGSKSLMEGVVENE
ncbi:MAG TPA: polyamine ABC transporter ATP-binding protein [Anaerovibrio sp.]|uniref:ABC transporter ATP-binding protein n=1 Tax=Anaerovibrio lipolyticus TaxID=82374 RepID=UPI000E90316C|nr:ABC transporter ATP-binding protein [Anaerovibrio lipolyticus]MBE6105432.1 ABC transporter ATP-binding protein [Anaerovibrio lipolyticus]HAF32272.1 polyamine ABC transporter ATP-binding protein [Anaerovibrio sp.]HAQ55066.1 polyamine ABC transporter ATP-binding protein [Anaerovibrio sp.]HCP95599.1 polyamine ABC transporter ATP-binding protein [Anaerovibrio sp.]